MSGQLRKGRKGCYVCCQPTDVIVQVWMREYLAARDADGNRRQKTVKSIAVSFCREHGDEFYARHTVEIPVLTETHRERHDMSATRARRGAPA